MRPFTIRRKTALEADQALIKTLPQIVASALVTGAMVSAIPIVILTLTSGWDAAWRYGLAMFVLGTPLNCVSRWFQSREARRRMGKHFVPSEPGVPSSPSGA